MARGVDGQLGGWRGWVRGGRELMRHTLQHTLQDTATQCDTLQHYSSVEVLPIALASAADKPDLAQVWERERFFRV